MNANISLLVKSAVILWRNGPSSDKEAEALIVEAGNEALQRGGLAAMSDLLDACHTYARDTMNYYKDEWRMIAVVWEANIKEWRDA